MEDFNSFYLTQIIGKIVSDEKSRLIDPHTLSIKFGMSMNVPNRGIKAEFLTYVNSSTRKNPSIHKYEVSDVVSLLDPIEKYSCCVAPNSLIVDFESFINTKYYDKCPRLFQNAGTKGSKHEYLDIPPEVMNRTEYLIKVITKFTPKLLKLKPQYLEITKETPLLDKRLFDEYTVIFSDMKKAVLDYGQKNLKTIKVEIVKSGNSKDTFASATSDWTLCIFSGTSIVGLQHNVFHSDGNGGLKSPSLDYNLFIADRNDIGSRFQFHDNKLLKGLYAPNNVSASKMSDLLIAANKVLYFDKSKLPPKGLKMLNKQSTKQSLVMFTSI